jgi:hypothetical protein
MCKPVKLPQLARDVVYRGYQHHLTMGNNLAINQIMQAPNVIGYVRCSEAGDVIEQEGNEVDVLANVIVYFQQIAVLIGESFGLEHFHEAQIQGKSLTVVCIPVNSEVVGVILNSRARVNEIVTQLRHILNLS